ncbi:hypothetical protein ACWA5Z_12170 [Testudinibacter sp. P80/BLE/0925]|uniref:hypothetical protein n=1 Tax=Testudinibacter sp. TW-1 TaxID=3417757 RepID=UPI003D35BE23
MESTQKALTVDDLIVGHIYSAKRKSVDPFGLVNDRQILYIEKVLGTVQYDSPTVARGRHYPKVSIDKFLRWAKEDVTSQMPKGEWRSE